MADARARAVNEEILMRANKELPTILSLVPDLKDVPFHVFERALLSTAYRFGWPKWILDVKDNNEYNEISFKNECHKRNAFSVMQRRCQDHAVTDSLDDCEMGDTRALVKLIHSHLFRPTPTGKQMALRNLYSLSMSTSDII